MDGKKILTDSLVSSVRLFVNTIKGIIFVPVITKSLGEAAFGTWVVMLAVSSLFRSVGGLHIHGALIRYTPQEVRHKQTLVNTFSLGLLAATATGSVVFVIGNMVGLFPESIRSDELLVATTALIWLRIMGTILRNYPRASGSIKTFELITLVRTVMETVFVAVVFWWFRSLIHGIWALVGIQALFVVMLAVVYLPWELRAPDVSSFRTYLRYSVPMVPKAMSSRVMTNADKYLLAVMISPTAVAIYSVSYSMARFLRNITNPLNSTLYPTVASAWDKGDFVGLSRVYNNILRGYTLIGFPAVIGISLLAEPLLLLISTEKIAAKGVYILPVLALGFFIRGYDNPLEYVINAAEENAKLAKITIVAAVANVILNTLTIPVIGIYGAVVATVVANIIIIAYVYTEVTKKIDIYMPKMSVCRSVAAASIMGGVLVITPLSLSPVQEVIVFPVVGVATYGLALVGLNEFSKTEIKRATSLIRTLF